MAAADNISLIVFTPESTLLERQVSKVSLPGSRGRFMVLKDHAPIISLLEEGDISFESAGVMQHVHILSGFVEVNHNKVTVCAEV